MTSSTGTELEVKTNMNKQEKDFGFRLFWVSDLGLSSYNAFLLKMSKTSSMRNSLIFLKLQAVFVFKGVNTTII